MDRKQLNLRIHDLLVKMNQLHSDLTLKVYEGDIKGIEKLDEEFNDLEAESESLLLIRDTLC